ncbi:MAG: Holliday junction resolvase RuvX [Gammaproteobacteria bacterium]|nr:Holliday junction resolvase RuvX [Gammaproteobacteria bacterium]
MTAPAARTVLAFDYGLRRIGIAVGNTLTGTAEPLLTVAAHAGEPEWPSVLRCVAQWQPAVLVVGVPYNAQAGDARLTAAAQRFAAQLGERSGLEVQLVDERLSSSAAESELRERRRSGARPRRVRRGDVDREAACLLLLQWLRDRPEPRAV